MQRAKAADRVSSMEHPDVIVMLARQRSGTNPLRDVLDSHPDLFCTPEVFHDRPSPDADLEVETNFFRFVEQHPKGRPSRAPDWDQQLEIFRDFLVFLREFTEKRFVVIDVKYNSTHHLNASWKFISAEPTMFPFIRSSHVRVLNLTRRNFLRYHLSQCKAELTQTWAARADRGHRDGRIEVDIPAMARSLELCRSENEVIDRSFENYGRYLNIDYAELFPVIGEPVSDDALGRMAEWLGVVPTFENVPTYRKQAVLGLRETIKNYEEVEEALRGTAFDYCLEDEPMYREYSTRAVD
jgi:LPS sulfotransferase NodH